jgi:histidyl-tRNA synthetase
VFELKWPTLGHQGTLVGGGRYDGLVQDIDGPPSPGVGFGMGMERILLATEKGEKPIPAGSPVDVYAVSGKSEAVDLAREVFALVNDLRDRGFLCDFDPMGRSMKAQMKSAARLNSRYALIVEPQGLVTVRDMEKSEQAAMTFDSFLEMMNRGEE